MYIRLKRKYLDTENSTIEKDGKKEVIELWLLNVGNSGTIEAFIQRSNGLVEAQFRSANGDGSLTIELVNNFEDIDKKLVECGLLKP